MMPVLYGQNLGLVARHIRRNVYNTYTPLPINPVAKFQQLHFRTKQKEQPDWENNKKQQFQEGTRSTKESIYMISNSIFDG